MAARPMRIPRGRRSTRILGSAGGRVNRVYGDPIDVWTHDDGRPARFVWRGRLYTVLAILDYSVVSREWWREQSPDPNLPADREFWRVQASPGRDAPRGTYELRHDIGVDDWLLSRAWD
jgi:Family of unknown function (DUF6504)